MARDLPQDAWQCLTPRAHLGWGSMAAQTRHMHASGVIDSDSGEGMIGLGCKPVEHWDV